MKRYIAVPDNIVGAQTQNAQASIVATETFFMLGQHEDTMEMAMMCMEMSMEEIVSRVGAIENYKRGLSLAEQALMHCARAKIQGGAAPPTEEGAMEWFRKHTRLDPQTTESDK